MKRSEINRAMADATACFKKHGWALPPEPKWDVTDFGLDDFKNWGLILVNLAEEPEYCEKLMYATRNQKTPNHSHGRKKEDIICRWGALAIQLWSGRPDQSTGKPFHVKVNGKSRKITSGDILHLQAGERITLEPGGYHEFWPESEACIIGEVSTYNDDTSDNLFINPDIGRYSAIEEDEPTIVKLVNE